MKTTIRITKNVITKGTAYTKKDKQGEKLSVDLYEMSVNEKDTFLVARESQSERPPCPQNKENIPYKGRVRENGELGFRIELYEDGVSPSNDSLVGTGNLVRTNVQIHKGPGYSEGCFLLTNDETGRDLFEKTIKESGIDDIEIWVE